MSKKNEIKTDYSSLFQHIQKYICGTIDYPELKHTTAPFGIYKQRNDKFMARIRVTGGEFSQKKLSSLIQIAEKYSIDFLHLTSRQDIQLQGTDIKNIIPIVKECTENDMPFRGGGGDTFRNVAVCYNSGFSESCIFDVLPYAKQLASLMFKYDKAFDNLPRKIKIGFSCSEKDTTLAKLQDLGFIAKVQDGIKGFTVYGGGGMGNQSSVGIELMNFIPAEKIFEYAIAMTDLFYDHGDRTSRSKARIRFILKRLGEEEFKKIFSSYLNKIDLAEFNNVFNVSCSISESTLFDNSDIRPTIELTPTELSVYDKWKERAVFNTKVDNIVLIKLFVPYGNLQTSDMKKITEIMSETKSRFIRLSREENIYIPIKSTDIKYVFKQLNDYRQINDLTGNSLKGLITSCIGAKTCVIGIIDSRKFSDSIAEELDIFFSQNPNNKTDFFNNIINSIKISGCPNSCSNHPSATLGFQGIRRKNKDGIPTDYCKVFIGGQPDKLNECIDDLLLDSNEIGKYTVNIIKKYYKRKKEEIRLSFKEVL